MTNSACPLCKNSEWRKIEEDIRDFEYLSPGQYAWIECASCGLIRIAPAPTPEILNLAYPPNYHAYQEPRSALSRFLLRRSYGARALAMARLLPERGVVLDVGCGMGKLLHEIGRRGNFTLLGVEYHAASAEQARQRGIRVWTGELTDAVLDPASLDLVIMENVLEHLYEPIETPKKIQGLLRPKGKLVGQLPNYDCWDRRLFGRFWGGGHAPRHIFHFTPATLRQTLEACGFENIKITASLHTGHWASSLQNFLRRNRQDTKGLICGRTFFYPFILIAAIPVNLLQMLCLKTGLMNFEASKP